MKVTLEIWRQDGPKATGHFQNYVVNDAEAEWSILELLDRLNDQIVEDGGDPVVFESDCREGVCGACGFMVNGCHLYSSPRPRAGLLTPLAASG